MKKQIKGTIVAVAMGALAMAWMAQSAKAVQIDFASDENSFIVFNGHNRTFSFSPGSLSSQMTVTASSAVLNNAIGDRALFTGTFAIGAITIAGPLQTAPVTGTGQMVIRDGTGHDLVGTMAWQDIATLGTGGVLNFYGQVSLTGITYSGTEADLLAFANAHDASESLTFQFMPAVSLTKLATGRKIYENSFSGTLTAADLVPDGGLTAALLGFALLGVEGLRRKIAR